MSNKVRIPVVVWEGLEAVRQCGATNMLDRPRVIELAEMMGYDETVAWLRENRERYTRLIFNGAAIEEEDC